MPPVHKINLTLTKIVFVFLFIASFNLFSENSALIEEEIRLDQYINEHVVDSNEWHPLPFIGIYFPEFSAGSYVFNKGLHATMLFLGFFFLLIIFGVLYKKSPPGVSQAPHGFTNFLEILVLFVRDEISVKNLGEKDGKKYAPLFLTIFFFILILNIMGLVPLFSTATSNINVTAGLAGVVFIMLLGVGFIRKGPLGFFKIFMPPGVPVPILFVLFPIEFLGLFIKPFALLIRLFANMLAGHLIIFSILGVIITFGYFGLPSFFLALFIYLLEILVAFIQAFIFTLLSAMFIGEMMHEHH